MVFTKSQKSRCWCNKVLAHLRTRGRGVLAVLITVGVEDHLNTVACAAETQGARMVYVQRAVGSNVATTDGVR